MAPNNLGFLNNKTKNLAQELLKNQPHPLANQANGERAEERAKTVEN